MTEATVTEVRRPRVILAHAGVQFSYQPAAALDEAEHLARFITTIYDPPTGFTRFLPPRFGTRIEAYASRRRHPTLGRRNTSIIWWPEAVERVLSVAVPRGSNVKSRLLDVRNHWFDRAASQLLGKIEHDVFIGLSGSCLSSLRMAAKLGDGTVVDQHDIHFSLARQLLTEECELNPDFASTMPFARSVNRYLRRVEAELHEADRIFVASSFALNSHVEAGVPREKLIALLHATQVEPKERTSYRPVRQQLSILFAGHLTQRKGIKYLLEAVRRLSLPGVTLTLVGDPVGTTEPLTPYADLFRHIEHLPHAELIRRFWDFDVLVLPSLYDAFGLVALDAMAVGLPVIVSANTAAGSDIVREGVEGFIVPIRDTVALMDRILRLYESPDLRRAMSESGPSRAAEYGLESYSQDLLAAVSAVR